MPPRIIDNFDLTGAFNYLVEDQDEGGMGLTRMQAEDQIARRLAREASFDVEAAQQAGFSNEEIISKLTGIPQRGFLRSVGKGIVEEVPETVAAAAGSLGALKAAPYALKLPDKIPLGLGKPISRALTKAPGPLKALGYVGTALTGGVLGAAAEEAIPLEEAVKGLTSVDDRVLPSDMPAAKAGQVGTMFGGYSALFRNALKKLPDAINRGQTYPYRAKVGGVDLGAEALLKRAARLREEGPGVPLSQYGGEFFRGLETGVETLGARARGTLPGYVSTELAVGAGAATFGGAAEYMDPGDAGTQFVANILGGGLAPVGLVTSPIATATRATARGFGRLRRGEAGDSLDAAAKKARERIAPWMERRGRAGAKEVLDNFNTALRQQAESQGLPYVPTSYESIHSLFKSFPAALEGIGMPKESIDKITDLAVPGLVGSMQEVAPLSVMYGLYLRPRSGVPAGETTRRVGAYNKQLDDLSRAYKDFFRQMMISDSAENPEFLSLISHLNRMEAQELYTRNILQGLDDLLPKIDKSRNAGRLTEEESAVKLQEYWEDSANRGTKVHEYLYGKVPANKLIPPEEFVAAWDKAKSGVGSELQTGNVQQILNRLSDSSQTYLAEIGIALPFPERGFSNLYRKYEPQVAKLKEGDKKTTTDDSLDLLDKQRLEAKQVILDRLGQEGLDSAILQSSSTVPRVTPLDETNPYSKLYREGLRWGLQSEESSNLFVPQIRDELGELRTKILAGEPESALGLTTSFFKGAKRKTDQGLTKEGIADLLWLSGIKVGDAPTNPRFTKTVTEIGTGRQIPRKLTKPEARQLQDLLTDSELVDRALENIPLEASSPYAIRPADNSLRGMYLSNEVSKFETDQLVKKALEDLEKIGIGAENFKNPLEVLSLFDKAEIAVARNLTAGQDSVTSPLPVNDVVRLRKELNSIGNAADIDAGSSTLAFDLAAKLQDDLRDAGTGSPELQLANDSYEAWMDVFSRGPTGKKIENMRHRGHPMKWMRDTWKGGTASDKAQNMEQITRASQFLREQQKRGLLPESVPERAAMLAIERSEESSMAETVGQFYRGLLETGAITRVDESGMPLKVRDMYATAKKDVKDILAKPQYEDIVPGERDVTQAYLGALDKNIYKVNPKQLNEVEAVLTSLIQKLPEEGAEGGAPKVIGELETILGDLRDIRRADNAMSAVFDPTSGYNLALAERRSLDNYFGSENSLTDIETILNSKTPQKSLATVMAAIQRLKKSETPVYSEKAGGKIAGREVYEDAKNAFFDTVFEAVANKTHLLAEFSNRPGGFRPDPQGRATYYSPAEAAYDTFFHTREAKNAQGGRLWNSPAEEPLMTQLIKGGMVTKEKAQRIKDFFTRGATDPRFERPAVERPGLGWISVDRALYEDKELVALMSDADLWKNPGMVQQAITRILGARAGSALQSFIGILGMPGSGTIQIPGIVSGAAVDHFIASPRITYLNFLSQFMEPGKGNREKLFDFLLEEGGANKPPDTVGPRALGRVFEIITGATLLPLSATTEYLTAEEQFEPPPEPVVEQEPLDLAMSPASPSVQPAAPPPAAPPPVAAAPPPAAPTSPAMRSQYAAAFPFDSASDIIRQQQARAPTQQGIGSLV